MSDRQKSWTWLFIMAALFIGAIGREAWQLATFNSDMPVAFDRVEVLNSPIHAGEPVIVRIWREKNRDDCTVFSRRRAVTQDGVAYDLPDAAWRGGAANVPFLDYVYGTLPTMPPGPYELRVHLTYTCPDIVFDIDQPTALFRIEP